tara:strand:+ start:2344 stop:2583 length:240 start_codon:yes stop_codon:yes gene_type:complete
MKPPTKKGNWEKDALVRVRVNLPRTEYEELEALARFEGMSVTDAIRRAIATDVFLTHKKQEGCTLLYEDRNGQMFRVKR